jgi:hypothetical protein
MITNLETFTNAIEYGSMCANDTGDSHAEMQTIGNNLTINFFHVTMAKSK